MGSVAISAKLAFKIVSPIKAGVVVPAGGFGFDFLYQRWGVDIGKSLFFGAFYRDGSGWLSGAG